jgi:transcription elongation factor Elf1
MDGQYTRLGRTPAESENLIMAKAQKRRQSAPRRSASVGHARVRCPHCGKRVSVPVQLGLGQQAYPCPACHVPIGRAFIEAEVAAEQPAATAEGDAAEATVGATTDEGEADETETETNKAS